LTTTSRTGASASTSHQPAASHAEEAVGKDVEAGTPEPDLTGLPTSTDLLEVYRGMVAQGRLAYDPEQVRIVMKVRLYSPVSLWDNTDPSYGIYWKN
jgi:protein AFG1